MPKKNIITDTRAIRTALKNSGVDADAVIRALIHKPTTKVSKIPRPVARRIKDAINTADANNRGEKIVTVKYVAADDKWKVFNSTTSQKRREAGIKGANARWRKK